MVKIFILPILETIRILKNLCIIEFVLLIIILDH